MALPKILDEQETSTTGNGKFSCEVHKMIPILNEENEEEEEEEEGGIAEDEDFVKKAEMEINNKKISISYPFKWGCLWSILLLIILSKGVNPPCLFYNDYK